MSEATAGTLVGYLRLDASQWHEELRRAGIAAEALDRTDPDIDIHVNAEEAVARLKEVEAEADTMGRKIKQAGDDGKRSISPLAAAIGILGPAIAPVGAAAVGLAAGFGAMGAAGVLAVLGIKREMEEGSSIGTQYAAALQDADHVLRSLTTTGANAFFGSLTQGVAVLQNHLLGVTPLISEMAGYLGQAAVPLVDAALSAFEAFRPVIREVAAYVVDFAERMNAGVHGDGFTHFIDYVAGTIPQVISTLESLVTAVGHIVSAASPLGGVVLTALEGIANAINAIDPSILQVVAVAAGSAYTAFVAYKALSGLGAMLSGIGLGARAAGEGMEVAATGARTLQASLGVVALAIGAAEAIYSVFAQRNQEVAAATTSYTDALIQSNGALDENVRLVALKKAQDDGAIEQGKMLGLSVNDVVDAYLGENEAVSKIGPAYDAAAKAQLAKVNAGQADASTMTDLNVAQLELKNKVGDSTEAMKQAKVAAQQHNEVLAHGSQVQGDYAAHVYTATDYINDQKAALDEWMQVVAEATQKTLTLEQAHDNATRKLQSLTKSIHDNGKQFTGNTKAALENRDAVRSYAESKFKEAQEVQKATGSNVKANAVIRDGRKALYDSMRQAGLTKAEAQRLIDKYLQIPKDIKTEVDLRAEAAIHQAATLRDIVNQIHSKTITITAKRNLQNEAKLIRNGVAPNANGSITAYANGGIDAFANGAENHVAQIAPAGAMRLWAEPETGGEAYIPLAPSKRDRSLAIWEETGKRLGALGKDSGNSEQVAAALLALAAELRSLHTIPDAVARGMAERARIERRDARARYSA